MRSRIVLSSICAALLSGCGIDQPDTLGEDEQELHVDRGALVLDPVGAFQVPTAAVCSSPGGYHCLSHVRTNAAGLIEANVVPDGYGAQDLQTAYNVPTTITGTPTIAIVDAYGYPQLEADLGVYRSQYGLPPCTKANGCLKIVNQSGQTSPLPALPPATDDWTLETALDVDMASASCPSCKILVVQSNNNMDDGLDVAQNAAVALGATVISNSWGLGEKPGVSFTDINENFNHPGIAIFVSTGDFGYLNGGDGAYFPSTSPYTIAVGGTTLLRDNSLRGYHEEAWSLAGSGCSLTLPKPAYQTGTGCVHKATADISAVADPEVGVAIYNSRGGGWLVFGGTSAAAPFVAGVFAATGNGAHSSGEFIKNNADRLYDVTSGKNGTCTNALLCNAGPGWDGPTGYGTPNARALGGFGTGSGTASGEGVGPAPGSGSGSGSGPDNSGPSQPAPALDGDVVGGCTVGGSGAGFATVLVLGFAAIRRRRVSKAREV